MYLSATNLQRVRRRQRTMKVLAVLAFVIILLASLIVVSLVPLDFADEGKGKQFYFGASFCGNTTAEGKLLIDRVNEYTNLFVLQSWPVSRNETAVYEVCDYAVAKGLSIIVNLGTRKTYEQTGADADMWAWQLQVWKNGSTRWGDKFIGAYYDDEPGGAQIDYDWNKFFEERQHYPAPSNTSRWMYGVYSKWLDWKINGTQPKDYNAETQVFLNYFTNPISAFQELKGTGVKTFISDYALHWFDYRGGYDVVLAQFGSNNSVAQAIQQVRGAARLQGKEWGVIVTWKYMQPPYLASGEEIFDQMMTAYQAGAKYVVLFDYPQMPDNPYGVLQKGHFDALEQFSRTVKETSNTKVIDDNKAEVVLVLPSNYGHGLRREDDRIWGYWGTDDKTAQVWNAVRALDARYRLRMDIVFDDPAFPALNKYCSVFLWNQSMDYAS